MEYSFEKVLFSGAFCFSALSSMLLQIGHFCMPLINTKIPVQRQSHFTQFSPLTAAFKEQHSGSSSELLADNTDMFEQLLQDGITEQQRQQSTLINTVGSKKLSKEQIMLHIFKPLLEVGISATAELRCLTQLTVRLSENYLSRRIEFLFECLYTPFYLFLIVLPHFTTFHKYLRVRLDNK